MEYKKAHASSTRGPPTAFSTNFNSFSTSGRPKSSDNSISRQPTPTTQRRPWSSSVLLEKMSTTTIEPIHELGHIPAYLRKKRSFISNCEPMREVDCFPKIEDENPPSLVPSELLDRQKTFVRRETILSDTFSAEERNAEETFGHVSTSQKESTINEPNSHNEMQVLLIPIADNSLPKQCSCDHAALKLRDQRIEELETFMVDIRGELVRLYTERDQREHEIQRLNKKLEALKENEKLIEEISQLTSKVNKLQNENENFRRHRCQFENDCNEIGDRLTTQEAPLDSRLQDSGRQQSAVERLEGKLNKYRISRAKLRSMLGLMIVENHRMKFIIEKHHNEIEANRDGGEEQLIPGEFEGIGINRVVLHKQLRNHKRLQQRSIAVRKYET
ncbi:uncharacterized protein LOC131430612 isoform X2 [Malaya genurostris]|uniref:uncharacterized protein LOC131430612 isoform X2 n=1 Tax=Malaya genurostris TaxID=325434 RepID=UPI0026F3BD64|nr:uncharacterized protein LOC131430612 isoform X2 [Malaya genurostris]